MWYLLKFQVLIFTLANHKVYTEFLVFCFPPNLTKINYIIAFQQLCLLVAIFQLFFTTNTTCHLDLHFPCQSAYHFSLPSLVVKAMHKALAKYIYLPISRIHTAHNITLADMKVIWASGRYEAKHWVALPAQGTLHTFADVTLVQAEGSTTVRPELYPSTVPQSSQLLPALLTWILSDLL